jgi:hypothetical protein
MTFNKTELVHLLSSNRLGPYLASAQGDLDRAMALYEQNQALSEALYVPLQNLEVGLRNRLNTLFNTRFGPTWFETDLLQKPIQIRSVHEAQEKLKRACKPLESGRIVAELNFGFWTGFFDGCYDQPLWHHYLRDVFLGASPAQPLTRKLFSGRLEGIRRLRNRVFHHEPIFWMRELNRVYTDIDFVMNALSYDLGIWSREHDRFPALLTAVDAAWGEA